MVYEVRRNKAKNEAERASWDLAEVRVKNETHNMFFRDISFFSSSQAKAYAAAQEKQHLEWLKHNEELNAERETQQEQSDKFFNENILPTIIVGVVIVVFFVILFREQDDYRKVVANNNLKNKILSEINEFGKDKAVQLYQGLEDIKNIRIEIQGKKDELGRVLLGLGKPLNTDEDYINFLNLIGETYQTEIKLQKALEDSFVLYKKFQISSDKSIEDKIKVIVSNGLISAEEIKTKYKTLREKYSK
ncbi:MAG: hypothetical protein HQM08_27600 [Candidatus Riflebacteria bacterium]|nr:hypothetical protein [Candidatus Riflebacteria bacterium]